MSEVELTNAAYDRWLRAMRPPFTWFLGLSEVEQETLAKMGEDHQADVCIAFGLAIKEPELAAAGMDAAENPEAEEALLRRYMAQAIQELQGEPKKPNGLSMGGLGQRRAEQEQRRQSAKNSGRRLFGRPPDGGTV